MRRREASLRLWLFRCMAMAIVLAIVLGSGEPDRAQDKEKTPPNDAPAIPGGNAVGGDDPGDVWCASISPDGRRIVATSGHKTTPGRVVLWELPLAKARWRLDEKQGVRSATFAPDGKTLALALYDGRVKLVDAATGKDRGELKGHKDGVNAVAFFPNGKFLVSASLDTTAKIWDLATLKERQTLRGHTAYVLGVDVAPDGKTIATASGHSLTPEKGGDAKLWDAATGETRATLTGQSRPVEFLAFSPDSKTVATASWDGTVKLWNADTGKERSTFKAHERGVMSVRFSPDGTLLATSSGDFGTHQGEVKLWDAASGAEVGTLKQAAMVWSVQFSPDGKTLVTACWDRTVRLWEVATQQQRAVLPGFGLPEKEAGQRKAVRLTAAELDGLWADLAGADAVRAYRGLWILTAAPEDAVSFLAKQRLKSPTAPVFDAKRVAGLIKELDDDDFKVRERSAEDLVKIGKPAEAALRKALKEGSASAEVRLRLESILERIGGPPTSGDGVRALRVIEVLEHIGTSAARELLGTLAKGAPDARLTQEAKAALARLNKSPAANP